MRFELEVQYADFHPDQVEKVGPVELEQALRVIESYPWERELAKIEERAMEDLTSTLPNVTVRNKENEILIISARDKGHHILEFVGTTHRGELIIPINIFDNSVGITVPEIVSRFYNGSIKNSIKLRPVIKHSTTVSGDVYKLREYPLFITGITVAVLVLILALDLWANGLTLLALPAVYFVGAIIFSMGFSAILTIQYFIEDWGKEVSFESGGSIAIRKGSTSVKLARGDIEQIAVVQNEDHRTLRNYKYARIKTKDGKVLIVTSFIIEPMDLVNRLRINHKDEAVFLPRINLDIVSERQKKRMQKYHERKKSEFLDIFRDYEDSKLREIVRDKKSYADYAVKAAEQIMENRQQNSR
jgi:hypothetical protein